MHHMYHFTPSLLPMSSYMHVCTGGDLFWTFSHCSMQEGSNAFLLCAEGGHLAVAEYLAPKMEGHLFESDDDGYTALHCAVQMGHLSMVEYLVRSCGFDVKARDKVGLHYVLLVWCILWPLWTHLLHGHSGSWPLLSCVNCVHMYQLMWYTTSGYVSPIRFHSVSLTSCAVGQHSTFESSTGRPCRDNSRSARKWKQCPGAEQCRLTNGYVVLLWSSMFVHWNLQIVPQILPKKLLPSSVP